MTDISIFEENIETEFLKDITNESCVPDLDFAMFRAICYCNNEQYSCERVCVKGRNGLVLQHNNIVRTFGFEIEAEDPRLICVSDKVYVIFICKTGTPNQNRGIGITEFNNFDPTMLRLRGVAPNTIEKNWAPFTKDGKLYFVYNYDPLVVLHYDFNKEGACDIVYAQNNITLPIDTDGPNFLRGGSNLLPYREDLYIGGCHSRVHLDTFYHFTHFVVLDTSKWEVVFLSKPILFNYNKKDSLTFKNTNIMLDINSKFPIQDPVSLTFNNEEYLLTISIRDSISHLYNIKFNLNNSLRQYKLNELQHLTHQYNINLVDNFIKK